MKILVTGATGFLGQALCAALDARGDLVTRVSTRNADLRRDGALAPWSGTSFDQIFHLAAWTQAGDFCLHHPGEQWIINQQINTNVLQWWQSAQPQAKLICMGTSCAYDPRLPLSEEYYLQGEPIESLYTYAMTKRMLAVGLHSLHRQFGLQYLCAVPSTLYGPGYHTDERQLHFIFDLMRKIVQGRRHGDPVVLWGDGSQRRELVYLPDFIDILLRLNARCSNEIVNIGAGEEHTIREFAAQICAIVDYDPARIHYDTTRYVGAASKCLRIDKCRTWVPEYATTPLPAGLARTVAWWMEQHDQGKRAGL